MARKQPTWGALHALRRLGGAGAASNAEAALQRVAELEQRVDVVVDRLPDSEPPAVSGDHWAVFHDTDDFLVGRVVDFLVPGLRAGSAAVVVADDEHRRALVAALDAAGVDVARTILRGELQVLDADDTLERLSVAGRPDRDRFHREIGAVLRAAEAASTGPVLVYGEMVAILWARGDAVGTLALERFWNELRAVQPFALVCGYPAALFDGGLDRRSLDLVCTHHAGAVTEG